MKKTPLTHTRVGFTLPTVQSLGEVRLPAAGLGAGLVLGIFFSSYTGGTLATAGGIGLAAYGVKHDPWVMKSGPTPYLDAASFTIPLGIAWLGTAAVRRMFA